MLERPLKSQERILIQYLLSLLTSKENEYEIPDNVIELEDGGMGSIKFNTKRGENTEKI